METITLKQHNIVTLSCTMTTPIGGNTVLSSVLHGTTTTPQTVLITGANTFDITINTATFELGRALMDIKVGNVSSDTLVLDIIKNIT